MRQSLRFAILERDQFRCRYCGRSASPIVTLEVDHIHPRSKGGTDDPDNLATACWGCNSGKGARVLRPIPTQRRYNVRTPSRSPDLEELQAKYPVGSHCATPLKIAAMGVSFGLATYAQAHRFCADLPTNVPTPPLRKTDYGWYRIVAEKAIGRDTIPDEAQMLLYADAWS